MGMFGMPDSYVYTHIVTLSDTNVTGNVYFAEYVRWQGIAREMFLLDEVPTALPTDKDQAVVTTFVECQFLAECEAFDRIDIHVTADRVTSTSLELRFDYRRCTDDSEVTIARGRQGLAWLLWDKTGWQTGEVPPELPRAIETFLARPADARSGLTKSQPKPLR